MRFVHVYLVGYVILVIGALAALWYGGVLQHVSPVWVAHRPRDRRRPRRHACRSPRVSRRSLASRLDTRSPQRPSAGEPFLGRRSPACLCSPACHARRSRVLDASPRSSLAAGARRLQGRRHRRRGQGAVVHRAQGGHRRPAASRCSRRRRARSCRGARSSTSTASEFEADLKRIVAFYRDRGFPDARVTSFDVQAQRRSAVGAHHASTSRKASRSCRADRARGVRRAAGAIIVRALETRLPLKAGAAARPRAAAGQPRDDARRAQGSRLSVAEREVRETGGSSERQRVVDATRAKPGGSPTSGRSRSAARRASTSSIVRRQLDVPVRAICSSRASCARASASSTRWSSSTS